MIQYDWRYSSFLPMARLPTLRLRMERPMTRRSIALFGLRAFVLTLAAARPAAAQTTLFEGARIIRRDGGTAIESGSLLVEGCGIARTGHNAYIEPPRGPGLA